MQAVRQLLPSSDIVYFGDIAHAPYGSKSQEELSLRTAEALTLLRERGAERIISACNTASASLALSLYDAFGMEPNSILEMVGPTVTYFKDSPERIILCATPATIRSGVYQNAFYMLGREVGAVAVPDLAGAIEFGEGIDKQKELIERAFKDTNWSNVDTLILACTHYPLALPQFRALIPKEVFIFDPAVAVAERAVRQFWPQEVRDGKTSFLINKDSKTFRDLVAKMFPGTEGLVEVIQN